MKASTTAATLLLLVLVSLAVALRWDGIDLIMLSNEEFMIETQDKQVFAAKLDPSIALERTLLQTSVEGTFIDKNTFSVTKIFDKLTRQNPRPNGLQKGLDKKLLIVFVDTSDLPGMPTVNTTLLYIRMEGISNYFFDNSYGAMKIANITMDLNLYRMPGTFATNYGASAQTLMSDAKTVVAAQSIYKPASFNFFIIMFRSVSAYAWAGLGSVGSSSGSVWLNNNYAFNVITHELGHNVGLNHANRLVSTTSSPFGGAVTRADYGDPFDVMGNTQSLHVSPISKRILGYLTDPTNVRTINATGTYELFAHDVVANSDKLVGLRIRHNTASNTWVMVSFRSVTSTQQMLIYGSLDFHVYYNIYDGNNSTDIINTNYYGAMYPLRAGFKFCDPSSSPMYCVFFARMNCATTPCSATVTVEFVTALPTPDTSKNLLTWTYHDLPFNLATHKFSTNTRWNLFFNSPYGDIFNVISSNFVANSHNAAIYSLLSTSAITGQFHFSNAAAAGISPYTIQTATALVTGITLTRTSARTYTTTYTPGGNAKNFYLVWNDMLVNSSTTLTSMQSLVPTAASSSTARPWIAGLHSVIALALDTADVYRSSSMLFYYEELVLPTFTLVTKVVNNAWVIELAYVTPPAGNTILYTTVFSSSLLNKFNTAPNANVINATALQMTTPAAATSNRVHIWNRYTITANTLVDFEYTANSACTSVTFGLKNSAYSGTDRGIFYNIAGTFCPTCKAASNFISVTGGWISARIPVGLLDFATKGGNQYTFAVFETTGASCVLQVSNVRWYEPLATVNSAASNTVTTRDISAVYSLQTTSTQVTVPFTGIYNIALSPPGLNITQSYTVYVKAVTGTTSIDATLEPTSVPVDPRKSTVINSANSIAKFANIALVLMALLVFLM